MSNAYAVELASCAECGRTISDGEMVVNWGLCNVCFDRHYDEYVKTDPTHIARTAVEEQGIGD